MAGNMTGQLLNNRYLVGERIGVGGMAEVYQGQDTVLGRVVAIKVMLTQFAEDPAFTARFRQEAAAAANLQSPFIVNVYDWGQDSQTSFIVMEFVRGSDLKTAIKERGTINQRKVAEIGSQVSQALSVAHGLDIIHRDIKPQNIMVQPDGNVKVMDFGIARAKNSVMDKTDVVLGTAHYISPEQAQGNELSPASDIYSLGVVLYEAVTGQLPFDGTDAVSVAMKQVNDQPAPPSELLPSINSDLEAIIMKAMAKDPAERFATAMDMRLALNDYLNGRPVNLDGMTNAQTAIIAPDATAVVNPVRPAYQTEKTAVLNGAEIAGGGRGGKHQQNYLGGGQNGKKKSKGPVIAIAVLAAVALIAILAFALLGRGCGVAGADVPSVTGESLEQATQTLKDAGFEVGTVDYVFDEKMPADSVISQMPREGTHQERGSKVALTVSQGVEQVVVPDLANMTANEARSELQKKGLKYEGGPAEHSDTVAENRVLRQSPAAGEKVNKGATVTYYLSAGKEKVEVPDVKGQLEGNATATLTNAGFKVAVDYQSSTEVAEGMVISQTPQAGSQEDEGVVVSLVVSTGAEYFTASAYVTGAAGGGSVSPESTTVAEGGSVTFYITTNNGYKITSVTDSNGQSYGAVNTVTIPNVKGNVSVAVDFAAVTPPSNTQNNGSANSSGSSSKSSASSSKTEKSS